MSATLTVRCPQCAKESRVPAAAVGKHGRCGQCNHRFLIELPAAAAKPPADEYDLAPLEDKPVPAAHRPPPTPLPAPAGTPGRLPPKAKSKEDSRPKSPGWLVAALALGGAALLICGVAAGVAVWDMNRAGRPAAAQANAAGGNGGKGVPAAAANAQAGGAEDIRRDPKPGSQFWIPAHPLASADPATWKVTAEETAPASGLQSLFVLPVEYPPQPLFAAPQAAQAAMVDIRKDPAQPESSGLYRLVWTRYDLRTGETLGTLPTSLVTAEPGWQTLCALSPSGKQLAIAFPYLPGQMEVWSDDGSKVAAVALSAVMEKSRPRRVRFASESRILVDVAGKVMAYDLL